MNVHPTLFKYQWKSIRLWITFFYYCNLNTITSLFLNGSLGRGKSCDWHAERRA